MLNHLLLGQTVTRPNGFWRLDDRDEARGATLRHPQPSPAAADRRHDCHADGENDAG